MPTEKKLTGYPSIDKPWLKHYTEEWSNDLIPQKTVCCNIYDNNINYKIPTLVKFYDTAPPVAPSGKLNVTMMENDTEGVIEI